MTFEIRRYGVCLDAADTLDDAIEVALHHEYARPDGPVYICAPSGMTVATVYHDGEVERPGDETVLISRPVDHPAVDEQSRFYARLFGHRRVTEIRVRR